MSLPVVSIGLTKRLPRMQKVLVTGGAGYVGSHTCLRLAEAGFEPVVYDNLSNGHQAFVRWGPFEQGDICEAHRLDEVFAKHRPVAVLHFAALIEVGESVKHPDRFYANNVAGALNLIEAARRAGVDSGSGRRRNERWSVARRARPSTKAKKPNGAVLSSVLLAASFAALWESKLSHPAAVLEIETALQHRRFLGTFLQPLELVGAALIRLSRGRDRSHPWRSSSPRRRR